MFHQEFEPPEELRDAVKCFWYTRRVFGPAPTAFEVVPDGYAEIIFHFGGSCSISANGELKELPSPFLMGLLNQPAVFYAKDRLEIIGIRCFPWSVFDLLGLPSGKDGLRLFEHPFGQLHPSLESCILTEQTEEAVDLVKLYLLASVKTGAPDLMLLKAGGAINEGKGNLPVKKVAAAAHATVRSLERKFRKSSGYSVKDVSTLMRFEQVRNRLWIDPDCSLAGLAAEMGYTDQSHLSREFKKYSGTTPSAFARKAKTGRTLISPDFIAFIPGHG